MPPAATVDPSSTGLNSHIWLLRLAYDGTQYAGWQIQPGHETVQGKLSHAFHLLFNRDDILPQGCSRTDAGVHALAQMVSIPLPTTPAIPVAAATKALNSRLPDDIRVQTAEEREATCRARDLVCGKAYTYLIHPGRLNCPFSHRYCWQCKHGLDLDRVRAAADSLRGSHDFSAFTVNAREPEGKQRDPICKLHDWHIREQDGILLLTVTGDRFLYKMVRRLVGFLVEVGRGRFDPEMGAIYVQKSGRGDESFETAPPQGLFLEETFMDEQSLQVYKPKGIPFSQLLAGRSGYGA